MIFDQSPVGRRYAECFEAARARLGLEVTGTASISALAEDATELLDRLRQAEPDVLVYLGSGVSSRAVALALAALGWDVPVLANSALMFGYARPDWRDGYAGWEYIDTIADDNRAAARLARASPARGGRTDRLRGVRHRPAARRGHRGRGAPDPGRDRRRAAPGEAAARDLGPRGHADRLRRLGSRGPEGPLSGAARLAGRSLGSGLTARTMPPWPRIATRRASASPVRG